MMARFLKKLEVLGRRALFRAVAPGSSSIEVLSAVPEGTRLKRVLLMRQDRIGDMVMTLPLIRRMRELHVGMEVGVAASAASSAVLRHETGMEVFIHRKAPSAFVSSLAAVREFAPCAAVDMHMHDSTTSFIYSLASGARWRLHVDRENRLPFNVRVPVPRDCHIMEAFAALLSGLGRRIESRSDDRAPRLSAEEREFAGRFWASCGLEPADCAVVNISAGGSDRIWPGRNYAAVCSAIDNMGLRPLIAFAPEDRDRAEAVKRESGVAGLLPASPTILHLAALLKGISLLVSPDTSVVHIAASIGVPVAGLYLPRDPSLPSWHPWQVPFEIVTSEAPDSLDTVEPSEVAAAAARLLAGRF